MARTIKEVSAARQRPRPDDSLLIRSAESLGRVIGTLRRQVDDVTERLTTGADAIIDLVPIGKSKDDGGDPANTPAQASKASKPGGGRTVKSVRKRAGASTAASTVARKAPTAPTAKRKSATPANKKTAKAPAGKAARPAGAARRTGSAVVTAKSSRTPAPTKTARAAATKKKTVAAKGRRR
jgi:hypothetical protein